MHSLMHSRQLMVYWAKKYLGSTAWSQTSLINYSSATGYVLNADPRSIDTRAIGFAWKCNFFVADVAEKCGTKTWVDVLNEPSINMPTKTRELTAKEWADPNRLIQGWTVAADGAEEAGDIASDGHHVGIVSGPKMLISASAVAGEVNEVKWDKMSRAVKRRFVGLTLHDIEGRTLFRVGKRIRTF